MVKPRESHLPYRYLYAVLSHVHVTCSAVRGWCVSTTHLLVLVRRVSGSWPRPRPRPHPRPRPRPRPRPSPRPRPRPRRLAALSVRSSTLRARFAACAMKYKARCARRGVNSRSTRRARPRLTEPTPRAPVPSRSLEEAGAEICYEPPSKLEGATPMAVPPASQPRQHTRRMPTPIYKLLLRLHASLLRRDGGMRLRQPQQQRSHVGAQPCCGAGSESVCHGALAQPRLRG